MAIRAAAATGNLTTAGTWGLVDQSSTTGSSYINSETGTDTLTTAFSGTVSAVFSWSSGAPTIDGIGIKISNRTGTTGTISVHLEVATVEVAGTLVTINMADLPAIVTASINGGWAFFKFASPVALANATSYSVAAKTSTGSMCNVYRDGTTDNLSRYLRTTATGAPAAGDDMIVVGEYTGAGTSNALTVTMDETATTDYGAASTSTVTPALAIGQGGTLTYGATAATAYILKLSGNLIVYANGVLSMGTTGTPCPRDSTMKLNFDCGTAGDFGWITRNLGTRIMQGQSRTSGKNIYYCKLNTDEAVNSISLGVDTDTGWLDNDEVAVATTTQTRTQSEKGTLNGNAGASSLTVDGFAGAGGGLANAHSGTSPTQAEVILLTRNVRVFGASTSVTAFIRDEASSTVDVDWAEHYWLGANLAGKQGIDVNTTSAGSWSMQFSSMHDHTIGAARGVAFAGTTGSCAYSDNVSYSVHADHLNVVATSGAHTISNNIGITSTTNPSYIFSIGDMGSTFTLNTAVGGLSGGISLSEVTKATGTVNNLIAHGNAGSGLILNGFGGVARSVLSTLTLWRNAAGGLSITGSLFNATISTVTAFGNGTNNVSVALGGAVASVDFDAFTLNGDTTFATTNGFNFSGSGQGVAGCRLLNSSLGVASGIYTAHTNDISVGNINYLDFVLHNTKLASGVEVLSQTNMIPGSRIASQKHDQTAGLHKTWKREGTLAIETGTTHTGSQAMSMTPNSSATSTTKFESSSFFAAVANGATVTPTVYLYKSAAYDGNQPRLVLKRNDALGVTSDTVLVTYASGTGSWNAISGATPAATDDGVFEFVIDCDYGTGGVVYVDTLSVA